MLKLSFLGASETVTGSCYLLENDDSKILIDCGMFQGVDVYNRNYEEFLFNPKDIDVVILTHAHMDHSGLLPKLVKHGFTGRIFLTPPTAQLAEILLLDTAKIQEIEFYKQNHENSFSPFKNIIYTTVDSLKTISLFNSIDFDKEIEIKDGIKIRFFRAGHILGAASILIEISGKKLIFSGDLGRKDESIIRSFYPFPNDIGQVDYIIMESLYGGEIHPTRANATEELLSLVSNTINNGGNVVIPSFAVHKTQEILRIFKEAFERNELNSNIKIILDSPLAMKATIVYESNIGYLDKVNSNMTEKLRQDIFRFPNLIISRTHKQSLKFMNKSNAVFIAGSGMAEGGRVIRHLTNQLPKAQSSIVFIGYQVEGTRGRALLEKPEVVELDNREVGIKAKIEQIKGFSSHGDNNDLLLWFDGFLKDRLKRTFLVHADLDRSRVFAKQLENQGHSAYIPKWKETVELE